MLTTRKINARNKSSKCNYEWLVYEHTHDGIISCNELGRSISVGKMGIHRALADVWDSKEIRWNVSSYNDVRICRLRAEIWDLLIRKLAYEASVVNFSNTEALKLKFYLIDNNGKKISKSIIL